MKILFTTDLLLTSTNGVVTSVRNLWEGLKNKGHDVRILTLSDRADSYYESRTKRIENYIDLLLKRYSKKRRWYK